MRKIKFRGKQIGGQWVYGYVRKCTNRQNGEEYVSWMISTDDYFDTSFYIDPATVGQYTGLNDNNGVEIYEGDVTECGNVVTWYRGSFHLERLSSPEWGYLSEANETITVIGNIHDKPQDNGKDRQ